MELVKKIVLFAVGFAIATVAFRAIGKMRG